MFSLALSIFTISFFSESCHKEAFQTASIDSCAVYFSFCEGLFHRHHPQGNINDVIFRKPKPYEIIVSSNIISLE